MQQHEVIQVSESQEGGFGDQLIKQCVFLVNTLVVGAAYHSGAAGKFIGVSAAWLVGMSPNSKYKRKNSLDWLIIKFTKRYLTLNFLFSSSLYSVYFVYYFIKPYLFNLTENLCFMFLTMQHQNIKLSILMISVYYAKHD